MNSTPLLTAGYTAGGSAVLAILLANFLSSFIFQYPMIKSAGKPSSMSVVWRSSERTGQMGGCDEYDFMRIMCTTDHKTKLNEER